MPHKVEQARHQRKKTKKAGPRSASSRSTSSRSTTITATELEVATPNDMRGLGHNLDETTMTKVLDAWFPTQPPDVSFTDIGLFLHMDAGLDLGSSSRLIQLGSRPIKTALSFGAFFHDSLLVGDNTYEFTRNHRTNKPGPLIYVRKHLDEDLRPIWERKQNSVVELGYTDFSDGQIHALARWVSAGHMYDLLTSNCQHWARILFQLICNTARQGYDTKSDEFLKKWPVFGGKRGLRAIKEIAPSLLNPDDAGPSTNSESKDLPTIAKHKVEFKKRSTRRDPFKYTSPHALMKRDGTYWKQPAHPARAPKSPNHRRRSSTSTTERNKHSRNRGLAAGRRSSVRS